MNILAIDSSSENLSLSILYKGKVLLDFNRRLKFGASKIVYFIDKILNKHHIRLSDMDAFAVGKGPGSFTGLRVSFSIIKGFMLVLKKPAICVGSFYSIAYPFSRLCKKIAVISDARRELVYASTFITENNVLYQDTKEKLISLPEFAREKGDYFFVTYDLDLYKKLACINPKIKFYKRAAYPKARYFLETAQKLYREKKFITVDNLEPLYLHPKTCQIRGSKE